MKCYVVNVNRGGVWAPCVGASCLAAVSVRSNSLAGFGMPCFWHLGSVLLFSSIMLRQGWTPYDKPHTHLMGLFFYIPCDPQLPR